MLRQIDGFYLIIWSQSYLDSIFSMEEIATVGVRKKNWNNASFNGLVPQNKTNKLCVLKQNGLGLEFRLRLLCTCLPAQIPEIKFSLSGLQESVRPSSSQGLSWCGRKNSSQKLRQDNLLTLCSLVYHGSGTEGPADVLLNQTKASQDTVKGWKSLARVAPGIRRWERCRGLQTGFFCFTWMLQDLSW